MKAKIVVILTVLALAVFSFTALGAGRGPGSRMGMGGGLNGLNLSSDQQQSILTIQQEFQKDTLDLRQNLQKKQLEMQKLWQAATLNQSALEAKSKEIIALQIQLTTKSRAMQEKVKKVLTPEQLKQWESRGFGKGIGPARRGGFPGCTGMGL